MHTGMIWFDNSQTTFKVKIQKAVEYYTRKYGRKPDLALVHPDMLGVNPPKSQEIDGVNVRLYRPVLPGHIWIGIEDKETGGAKP